MNAALLEAEAGELLAILDSFIERAGAAAQKGDQAKVARRYRIVIARRFRAQRDWFLQHALPHLKTRVAESLQEASDEEAALAISKLLDEWLEDPEFSKQIRDLLVTAQALGVSFVEGVLPEDVLKAALSSITAEAGVSYSFGLDNPRAITWLADHVLENAGPLIDGTTRDALAKILVDGLTNKQSYSQIASTIRAQFNEWSRSRAETIATYEVGNAYTQGILAASEDLRDRAGLSMEKAWLTAGDDRVSDECGRNEEEGWISLDDDFSSGDEAPLAHPNCRCALQVRRVEKEVVA